MIWDEYEERVCTEISFHSDVIAMKLSKELFLVVLEDKSYVFTFSNMECIDQIESYSNPTGICAISSKDDLTAVAIPHKE